MTAHKSFIIALLLMLNCALLPAAYSQCVVINEIMVNPNSCDCGCANGNGEWIELYNTCSTPVNIGCYVLTDGDFTVTIPVNTILNPYDYYVIGSPASGGTIDLNLQTCNCTDNSAPDPIGCYTNSNEQAILVNSSGALQDAVYWGNGQFPVSISSGPHGSCSGQSISFPAVNANFELIPKSNPGGCSIARNCDGVVGNWVQRCGAAITINASNGPTLQPSFVASDTTLCPGDCINFTNTSTGTTTSWTWTLTGSNQASSVAFSPVAICYPNSGSFSVTLQGTNACGNFTLTKPNYIVSASPTAPTISPTSVANLCQGDSVTLHASTASNYQWKLNNAVIPGATGQDYTVKANGGYTVETGIGHCAVVSNSVLVNFVASPVATITALGPTTICGSGTTTLEAVAGFSNYLWLKNGSVISGQTAQTLTVNSSGNYSVVVTNANNCKDTSSSIQVQASSGFLVKIVFNDSALCLGETAHLSLNNSYPNVVWSTGSTANSIDVKLAGLYKVQASNSAGCSGRDSIQISVYPLPLVDAGRDTSADCANGISLNGSSSVLNFSWSPSNDLSNPLSLQPIAKPKKSTIYTLTVSDAHCSADDEVFIAVDCGSLYLPNSFTPNDDGVNDQYMAIGNGVKEFELRIYNRWGELVFESNQITQAWDGKYKNLPVPSGVYVREVKAKNELDVNLLTDEQRFGTIVVYR